MEREARPHPAQAVLHQVRGLRPTRPGECDGSPRAPAARAEGMGCLVLAVPRLPPRQAGKWLPIAGQGETPPDTMSGPDTLPRPSVPPLVSLLPRMARPGGRPSPALLDGPG